jgi:hypothetical protein
MLRCAECGELRPSDRLASARLVLARDAAAAEPDYTQHPFVMLFVSQAFGIDGGDQMALILIPNHEIAHTKEGARAHDTLFYYSDGKLGEIKYNDQEARALALKWASVVDGVSRTMDRKMEKATRRLFDWNVHYRAAFVHKTWSTSGQQYWSLNAPRSTAHGAARVYNLYSIADHLLSTQHWLRCAPTLSCPAGAVGGFFSVVDPPLFKETTALIVVPRPPALNFDALQQQTPSVQPTPAARAAGWPISVSASRVYSLALSPDGRWLYSSNDAEILRWDAQTGAPAGEPMLGHTDSVRSLVLSLDGLRLYSAGIDATIRRWDAQTGTPIGEPMRGHVGEGIESLILSPDGLRLYSAGYDNTIRRWDAQTGAPIGEPMRGHVGDGVISLALSPDGLWLYSGDLGGTVRRWNAQTGAPIGEPMHAHAGVGVSSLALSPDGRTLYSCGFGGGPFRLWNAQTGDLIGESAGGELFASSLLIVLPDCRTLYTAGEQRIYRWNAQTGAYMETDEDFRFYHDPSAESAVLSRDGRTLYTAQKKQIRRWNAKTREMETA